MGLLEEEQFLIDRFYDKLGDVPKTKIKLKDPPHVKRVNRKTFFVNFEDYVSALRTTDNFLKRFIESEFSCSSSIDSNHILILDKIIHESKFMRAIKVYINKYLKCPQCKNTNTNIIRENRLNYIKCLTCLSKTNVILK